VDFIRPLMFYFISKISLWAQEHRVGPVGPGPPLVCSCLHRSLLVSRAGILKIKPKIYPRLEPSLRPGLSLGLQLVPMILIGSDLTNERALSANQLIDLNWLSVNFENPNFTYLFALFLKCVYLINLANSNTTDTPQDFKCKNMIVFTKVKVETQVSMSCEINSIWFY